MTVSKLTRDEYYKWLKGLPDGMCTFCAYKKEVNGVKQEILKEFEHWVWIGNIAPYWDWFTVIIPKRHFEEYGDMTFRESAELIHVIDYCTKKILDAPTGESNQIRYAWKNRFEKFDRIKQTVRPVHFHINIGPDLDGRLDPTIQKDAYKKDTSIFK